MKFSLFITAVTFIVLDGTRCQQVRTRDDYPISWIFSQLTPHWNTLHRILNSTAQDANIFLVVADGIQILEQHIRLQTEAGAELQKWITQLDRYYSDTPTKNRVRSLMDQLEISQQAGTTGRAEAALRRLSDMWANVNIGLRGLAGVLNTPNLWEKITSETTRVEKASKKQQLFNEEIRQRLEKLEAGGRGGKLADYRKQSKAASASANTPSESNRSAPVARTTASSVPPANGFTLMYTRCPLYSTHSMKAKPEPCARICMQYIDCRGYHHAEEICYIFTSSCTPSNFGEALRVNVKQEPKGFICGLGQCRNDIKDPPLTYRQTRSEEECAGACRGIPACHSYQYGAQGSASYTASLTDQRCVLYRGYYCAGFKYNWNTRYCIRSANKPKMGTHPAL